MPVTLTIEPLTVVSDQPTRKRWTRTECDRLQDLGVFDGQRYELIDGELIHRMGQSQPHVMVRAALMEWLVLRFPGRVVPGGPLEVALMDAQVNEPEPDLCLLHRHRVEVVSRPQAHDVALLIEVADSTLVFDTTVKAKLYARAGVLDYWVVDVKTKRVIVFREPRDGEYASVAGYEAGEAITPLSMPELPFRLGDLRV